ncbi:MAG: ImmA/IrrE family metallo-endopeptidase [Spirochaetaceae bacterium]|nr:ImmA/IrrE family metallo-endopeptidase [Spirochaetaceae bacterium]
MSELLLVPTGNIIKDYLEENNITQKELSISIGMSEKHISNVLKGKSRVTEEFALKIEKVMPSIKADYWINYESKFQLDLMRQKELYSLENLNLKEISHQFHFSEIFKGLKLSLSEQAVEMLKILKISNFDLFENKYGNICVDFMEDGGEKEAIAIWLNLCREEIEIQNNDLNQVRYNKIFLINSIKNFKLLALNDTDSEKSLLSCRKLFNELGVYFVVYEANRNCKVRGALTSYKNKPTIYISRRGKRHSYIWFAIFHEIGHLILHYDKNNKKDIKILLDNDISQKENEANTYARNLLIPEKEYMDFIKNKKFDKMAIIDFANKNCILPSFVVDFLKHDKQLDYDKFCYL